MTGEMRIVRWKERARFVRSMPRRSYAAFLCGVACLFAGLGSVNDALNLERSSTTAFVRAILISGIVGAGWAWLASRRMIKSMIAFGMGQCALYAILARYYTPPVRTLNIEQWRTGVATHAVLAIILINLGYIFFISFFQMEGKRFFAVQTEMELATAIQRKLVPPIAERIGGFEFHGASLPSGSIGGDLLDVVQTGRSACAYLADVAGHGVPAGVLMSMVKAAVRTRLASNSQCDDLLTDLNEVLTPLTDSNAYATFAYR
jgi:Stage II sporulation protein E (SpoIIE)